LRAERGQLPELATLSQTSSASLPIFSNVLSLNHPFFFNVPAEITEMSQSIFSLNYLFEIFDRCDKSIAFELLSVDFVHFGQKFQKDN
jgi:hypothetical protein